MAKNRIRRSSERGAATVEHAGLALLVALLVAAGVAALAADPPERAARELATAIARKLRCGPSLPGPCWRDPLTSAYGRPLAGLVRALAPVPEALPGPGGRPLLPVSFPHCRTPACAVPGERPELTASRRRVTVYVAVRDRRRAGGGVTVDYWEYRPTLGWRLRRVRASSADVLAHARTPLLETAHPRLVPLETLAGRNHVRFAPREEPPWRWRVESAP
ncbi:MAG TPA: hypothetical protein VIL04_08975 [Solirubrobacterales bacterium]